MFYRFEQYSFNRGGYNRVITMGPETRESRCFWVSDLVHLQGLTREFQRTVDPWLVHIGLSKSKLKFTVVLLAAVLLLSGAYYATRLTGHSIPHESYFTVVVDCGSTGSRVNIYKWFKNSTDNKEQQFLLKSFPDHLNKLSDDAYNCKYHCMQTEPGLDKYVFNTSGVKEALEPLLLWAEKQIPSERHMDTSLFVLATAGLRKLPTVDANWILETVEAIVKTHPFMYTRNSIRVLSGKEEAYYGWAALNYKMGRLKSSFDAPTFGVLDLGGSSLQVVMETDKLREVHHIVRSKIGSIEHEILAYSLPMFGLNEAFDRSIVMLSEKSPPMKKNNGRFQLRHPCLSSKVSRNYTCHGCLLPNATKQEDSSSELLTNQSTSLNLVGSPDWEECRRLVRASVISSSSTDLLQLLSDTNCKANSSSSESVALRKLTVAPRQVTRFHALSGFFAVYDVLNLSPKANLTTFLKKGQELCSDLWSGLKKFPGDEKYAEQFCFNVPYLDSIIKDALCMGDTELIFGPGDVSWTLGAALVEGKPAWSDNLEAQGGGITQTGMEGISSPILSIILFFSLSFMVYMGRSIWDAVVSTSMPSKKSADVGVSLPYFIPPKRQSN